MAQGPVGGRGGSVSRGHLADMLHRAGVQCWVRGAGERWLAADIQLEVVRRGTGQARL